MRAVIEARSGALIAIALLLGACSSETGILVGVSGSSVQELVFQVGIAEGDDFLLDHGASGEIKDVRGRDLRLDPYELLLRPEDPEAPPPAVRVLVLGQTGGKLVSFAVMDPPQGFLTGEVLRRGLALQGLSTSVSAGAVGKCFQARLSATKSYRWIARSDRDCDGVSPEDAPPDCDDSDSAIKPGAKELCDGKDNNCDGKYLTGSSSCYKSIAAAVPCREGSRSCAETAGKPAFGECTASESSPAVPRAYCQGGKVEPLEGSCTVEATASGLCPGSLVIEPPSGQPSSCVWALIADGGWPLSLDGGSAPSSVQGCKPTLAVSAGAAPAKPGTVVLELEGTEGTVKTLTVIHATFETKSVPSCSATPIVCTHPGG